MCPPEILTSEATAHPQPLKNLEDIVPNTKISKAAFDHASALLAPAVLNHSVRVYLYAKAIAEKAQSEYATDTFKHDLLFVASLFHDIGTVEKYNGPLRFEVEGGDAAVSLLGDLGVSEEDVHRVWMAIALHTSKQIAERINELCRITRQAIVIDFGRRFEELESVWKLQGSFEAKFPRLGIEKLLGDVVTQQAVKNPEKAPGGSWPNDLYKAYLAEPDWEGVNKGF